VLRLSWFVQEDYQTFYKVEVTVRQHLQILFLQVMQLILVDLSRTGVTGWDAQQALEAVGIVANRNAIPFDSRPPRITSGMRFGTPALTTRGMGKTEMQTIAAWIIKIISHIGDEALQKQIKEEVHQMCGRFPVPGIDC
jgi:glycine hydroxymethyltransferase